MKWNHVKSEICTNTDWEIWANTPETSAECRVILWVLNPLSDFNQGWPRHSLSCLLAASVMGMKPMETEGFHHHGNCFFCYWCSMIYGSSHTSKSEKEQITKSVIDSHSPSKGTWHREWTETALDVREFRVCRVCPCDGFRRGCLRTWGILGFFKRNCEKLWEMRGEESWHNYGIIMWKYWMIIGE